jgi:hypothetical protein
MVEGLSELVAACGVHRLTSSAERVAEGDTHWFIGYAAAAPAEMIALRQTETLKLMFRQEDVREVKRHGERFLLRLRDGANMLVSFEQVIKAAPTCDCGDGRSERSTSPNPRRTREDVIDVNPFGNCRVRIECFEINIPLLGPTRVCVPTQFYCLETDGQPN